MIDQQERFEAIQKYAFADSRFIDLDGYQAPPSDPGNLDLYLFCGGDPVNNIDPSGHDFTLADMAITGGVIGAISGALIGGIKGGPSGIVTGALYGGIAGVLAGAGIFVGGTLLSELTLSYPYLFGGIVSPAGGGALIGAGLTGYSILDNLDTLMTSNNPRDELAAGVALGMTAFAWYAAVLGTPAENMTTGGRMGSATTRQQLSEISTYMKSQGWEKIAGGPGSEEYLPSNPSAGAPKGNYVDATFIKNGKTIRIQTVTVDSQGNPIQSELDAAASIRAKTPTDHLLLIPKNPSQ
jgi:hypothetical protein